MEFTDNDQGYLFTAPEHVSPGYSTFWGSIMHVYFLTLGEFDTDAYELGDSAVQKIIL